jgi:hypothetical protein
LSTSCIKIIIKRIVVSTLRPKGCISQLTILYASTAYCPNTTRATSTGQPRRRSKRYPYGRYDPIWHRPRFCRIHPVAPDFCSSKGITCPVLIPIPHFRKHFQTSLYQVCRTKSSVTVDTAIRIDLRPSAEVARLYPQEVFLPPEG